MSAPGPFPLIAVDVGNSRVKLLRFDAAPDLSPGAPLPKPDAAFALPSHTSADDPDDGETVRLIVGERPYDAFTWQIGSVQRQVAAQFVERLQNLGASRITLLSSGDLPLAIDVPRPDMVGIDRLLGAVAANQLRNPARPAVVVHVGSAITVNLVGVDGAFRGGAILPGLTMSARAMHQFTDLLPLIDMDALAEPPPPVGTATVAAMTSGLYWGAVGGVKQLIELFGREAGGEPDVFLTGGAAPSVAKLLPGSAQFEPHLVPCGIAIAAASSVAT